jgi:hypothetical protein
MNRYNIVVLWAGLGCSTGAKEEGESGESIEFRFSTSSIAIIYELELYH